MDEHVADKAHRSSDAASQLHLRQGFWLVTLVARKCFVWRLRGAHVSDEALVREHKSPKRMTDQMQEFGTRD